MPSKSYFLVSNSQYSTNISAENNSFTVVLKNSFTVPNNAKNTRVYCRNSSIVNYFYNISVALGNNTIYWTDDVLLPQKYTITFPDGAYDSSDLNNYLKNHFTQLGYTTYPFLLLSNNALQKIIIQLEPNYGIKIPSALHTLLGFTANYTQFNNTAYTVFYQATSSAKFNNVISLVLSCSIVNTDFNSGEISNSLCVIPITTKVGSLLAYQPQNPTIQYTNLQGTNINSFTLTIRDQLNRTVTIPESWNVELCIEWDE